MRPDYTDKVNITIVFLDGTFNYFKNALSTSNDDVLKSHIAKYLTVLTYGSYESVIKDLIRDFVDQNSKSPLLSHYANKIITDRHQNLDFPELKGFLNAFDKSWGQRLDQKFDDRSIECFSNITSEKNIIAHNPNKCEITFSEICDYYEGSKAIIKYIADILNSPEGTPPWVNLNNFFKNLPSV
jgi:hypothetical protein